MRWKSSFFVLSLYVSWLFPCHQCIRNWSQLSAAGYPITGDVFCAASSPGIASDRPWPTLSRATTIRSRRTRTVSAGSSSHGPERHGGGAILLFCGKSRSQRVGCRTIHHERRSGWTNISGSTMLRGNMDFHQPNWKWFGNRWRQSFYSTNDWRSTKRY